MPPNIEDPEAEREAPGESTTAAVRNAMRERRDKPATQGIAKERGDRFLQFLRDEIWPLIPDSERGKPPMTKAEREEILGIGPDGV